MFLIKKNMMNFICLEPTNEQPSKPINNEDMLKRIIDEIMQVLRLNDDDENKDIITNDLTENGRQSLKNYEEDIPRATYKKQMNDSNGELMKVLKKYFELQWELQYISSNPWFIAFLKQYRNGEGSDWYEHILTRTAHHGNKYMKKCPILSVVVQLLFERIDDKCLEETNIFNELWLTITNNGLQSIKKYSDYISQKTLNQQLDKKQSILFQALREYYRQELFQLLEQCKIANTENLYDLALDNVAEHGWINGIKVEAIEDNIARKKFDMLLERIRGNFDLNLFF